MVSITTATASSTVMSLYVKANAQRARISMNALTVSIITVMASSDLRRESLQPSL